jgi:hypothetical protein
MFPGDGTPLACPVWRLPNGITEDASCETLLFLKHYVKEPAFVPQSGTSARQALAHHVRILAEEKKSAKFVTTSK